MEGQLLGLQSLAERLFFDCLVPLVSIAEGCGEPLRGTLRPGPAGLERSLPLQDVGSFRIAVQF